MGGTASFLPARRLAVAAAWGLAGARGSLPAWSVGGVGSPIIFRDAMTVLDRTPGELGGSSPRLRTVTSIVAEYAHSPPTPDRARARVASREASRTPGPSAVMFPAQPP